MKIAYIFSVIAVLGSFNSLIAAPLNPDSTCAIDFEEIMGLCDT